MTVTELGKPATGDYEAEEARLRRELAAVYRLIAHFKMTDLIYNHISVRLPGPEHRFLLNPYGLLYEEITASSLVIVGLDGQLITDGPWRVNPAGFVIHSAIHEAREDALCVLHTHTKAGCAVAAQEHGLLPLNQMSLEFYNRVGYHDYEGIALSNAEKKRLVADLGDKPVMILRNHGLLTVGKNIPSALRRMYMLERACEVEIIARGLGEEPTSIEPEVIDSYAQRAKAQRASPEFGMADWRAAVRQIEGKGSDWRQ